MKDGFIVESYGLTKRFGSNYALDKVDLRIGRGKIVGLLGPNGSGKTTFIKLLNGLLQPTAGDVYVDGQRPGPYTKSIISYLPDKEYFASWMTVKDVFDVFSDFYSNFDRSKAVSMAATLGITEKNRIKAMSKGTKEKLQLILVMSRDADLYLLDEPIAGVDPAARDFILATIISNYREDATIIISTHLISDIERVLDEVIFINDGHVLRHDTVDRIKEVEGKSIDELFRQDFRMGGFENFVRQSNDPEVR